MSESCICRDKCPATEHDYDPIEEDPVVALLIRQRDAARGHVDELAESHAVVDSVAADLAEKLIWAKQYIGGCYCAMSADGEGCDWCREGGIEVDVALQRFDNLTKAEPNE